MIPFIQKGDLRQLHTNRQKAICGCEKRCTEFYTFVTKDEKTDFILCTEDARQFGFEILEMQGAVKSGIFINGKSGKFQFWTSEEERFVEKYFSENECYGPDGRVKQGVFTVLGELLGRPRKQVADKAKRLRKMGLI